MPATAVAIAGIPATVVAKAGMPATIGTKSGMPTTIPVTAARQKLEMPVTVGTLARRAGMPTKAGTLAASWMNIQYVSSRRDASSSGKPRTKK